MFVSSLQQRFRTAARSPRTPSLGHSLRLTRNTSTFSTVLHTQKVTSVSDIAGCDVALSPGKRHFHFLVAMLYIDIARAIRNPKDGQGAFVMQAVRSGTGQLPVDAGVIDSESDLVARHQAALKAFFRRRTGGSGAAEDLCQDCFLIFFAKLRERGGLRDFTRADAYLWGTARLLLLSYRRGASTRQHDSADIDVLSGEPGWEPLASLEQFEIQQLVAAALDGQPTQRDREMAD